MMVSTQPRRFRPRHCPRRAKYLFDAVLKQILAVGIGAGEAPRVAPQRGRRARIWPSNVS